MWLFFSGLAATPAWTGIIPAQDLLAPHFSQTAQKDTPKTTDWASPVNIPMDSIGDSGSISDYMNRIILDESWEEWLSFQRDLVKVMPLLALKRIIKGRYRAKKRVRATTYRAYQEVIRSKNERQQYGRINLAATEGPIIRIRRDFDFFGWLTAEQGLFSGTEWSWDNFLPRIATIAGMLILGLFATELLHYIFVVGAKEGKGGGGSAKR